jgi:uncharacterized integral membrane protein (TIGR00697 family)
MPEYQSASASDIVTPEVGIQFKFYFLIMSLFASTWLIANIAAIKLVSIFGITLTGGFIIFPLTTLFASIIVEVYGYKNARQALWVGLILNIMFVVFTHLVNIMPSSPHWKLDEEFHKILLPETRIIFASLISFCISTFFNSILMTKMKIRSRGKSLIKRILVANSISLFIDITCFLTLAFYGAMPNGILFNLISVAYLKKIAAELILFPLTWYLIYLFKKKEGVDIYDLNTNLSPFSLDNVYELNSSSSNLSSRCVSHVTH